MRRGKTHSFRVDVADKFGIGAALTEGELFYRATTGGVRVGDVVALRIPWGELTEKFDYLITKENWMDCDDVSWLGDLETAGIIELDADDDRQEWIILVPISYLAKRAVS